MCLYPTLIKNKKYQENKKNRGIIPPIVDLRTMYVTIGCQECIECRKQKAREWQVRMMEDIKTNTNGKFVTLTLSNESLKQIHNYTQQKIDNEIDKIRHYRTFNKESVKKIEKLKLLKSGYKLDNEIATQATKLWRERWRKEYRTSPRHWLITELGHNGTENIHLHGIIWTDKEFDDIKRIWKYGYIWPRPENKRECKNNYVSAKTVNYIIKYITKQDKDHYGYKSKILTSPGIGNNFTKTLDAQSRAYKEDGSTNETYRTKTGHKISMPIYWRNKIYSEEEREKLWIQKLDKQERYVGGEKIDVSKGEEDYYKTLEWYRRKSSELGYGTGKRDWKKQEYAEKLRELRILQRMYGAENAKFIQENEAPF